MKAEGLDQGRGPHERLLDAGFAPLVGPNGHGRTDESGRSGVGGHAGRAEFGRRVRVSWTAA
jgi:hypothetical protein